MKTHIVEIIHVGEKEQHPEDMVSSSVLLFENAQSANHFVDTYLREQYNQLPTIVWRDYDVVYIYYGGIQNQNYDKVRIIGISD